MRFKDCMINSLVNFHEETVIANNESEAERNVQLSNPNFMVLKLNGCINNYY